MLVVLSDLYYDFQNINKTNKMILNTVFTFFIIVDYSYDAQRVMERTTQCEG